LDSSDISFMTNRAAVYLEMGKFQECIADCDAAVEKGRELRADYKVRRHTHAPTEELLATGRRLLEHTNNSLLALTNP
jgi:hypothetical protein